MKADIRKIDFEDTSIAFSSLNDHQLNKAKWMFRLFSNHTLVDIGSVLTRMAFDIGLPVKNLVKHTIYEHFCGGEVLGEVTPTIEHLAKYNVKTILDYGVEGKENEADFEASTKEQIRAIEFANGNPNVPYISCKFTGYAPFSLLEKMHDGIALNAEEQKAKDRMWDRLLRIGKAAASSDVALFVDAEESWIQNAIDELVTRLMQQFNGKKAVIGNTVQLYLKDRLELMKSAHKRAAKEGYIYGIKLVRGAYLQKERDRAEKMGYEDPTQPDKEHTDRDYNLACDYCLENINEIAFCAATHNEDSSRMLAEKAFAKGISPSNPHLVFSQLYGMSDHISFNLAKLGFNASKYVPYGPVKNVVPYLIRRAQENTSVAGQMSRELSLLKQEYDRRKQNR